MEAWRLRWPHPRVLDSTRQVLGTVALVLCTVALVVQLQLSCRRQPFAVVHSSTSAGAGDVEGQLAVGSSTQDLELGESLFRSRGSQDGNRMPDTGMLSLVYSSSGSTGNSGRRGSTTSSAAGRFQRGSGSSRNSQRQQSSGAWASGLSQVTDGLGEGLNPKRMARCVNERFTAKNMTWAAAMSDDIASVKALGVWWSQKKASIPVTLVTQASANRIPQVLAQCVSWGGPMSVALYTSIVQEDPRGTLSNYNRNALRTAVKATTALFQLTEGDPQACKLDIILVFEVFTEPRARMLYPVNVLRNLARLQARTELVALMDVDMLVSSKMAKFLRGRQRAEMMVAACRRKVAWVLPAFETYANDTDTASAIADHHVRQSKAYLVRSMSKGLMGPFDQIRFPQGHNVTNFMRWYNTTAPYEIAYQARYEPWVIVHRHLAPWHDVRFRGYGNNKIVLIAALNASAFHFAVHPQGFIIHRAHAETSARVQLINDMSEYKLAVKEGRPTDQTSIYGHTKMLFDNAKEAMDRGTFVPQLDPATEHCLTQLPWWQRSLWQSLP